MKIVQVTYTTQASFSAQNQANIQQVMQELQQLDHPGIRYTACLSPDGRSFTHTAFFQTEKEQQLLNECVSFKHFQDALKASNCEAPPKQALLTLIGSSHNIFDN